MIKGEITVGRRLRIARCGALGTRFRTLPSPAMPASGPQAAKRTFVSVILRLARIYAVAVGALSRESPDPEVLSAFRKVARRAHSDKGGSVAHAQELHAAKDAWEEARPSARAGSSDGQQPSSSAASFSPPPVK